MRQDLELLHGKPIRLSEFPGIGGPIRVPNEVEAIYLAKDEKQVQSGHGVYVGALLLRMLEYYFISSSRYTRPHIQTPFGSLSTTTGDQQDGIIYERIEGAQLLPRSIGLKEWDEFVKTFRAAGIDIDKNTGDIEDPRLSRKIIHSGFLEYPFPFRDNVLDSDPHWIRIGVLGKDIPVNEATLLRFIDAEIVDLSTSLGMDRYFVMKYGAEYLFSRQETTSTQFRRLEDLVKEARLWVINGHPRIQGRARYMEEHDRPNMRYLT